ncbi:hypothetical protein HanXRQr2_Chr03g0122401 [Helianthus annuus]|uniref:Uncharacterized protein n=1 Tax=Helianthus annuus TaxID=4232 RepID=A0A9K3NVY6_HELAN|nr:hypothetical protein HanXRQr2_Chr03g0122401 [Helianthus annuus]
MHAQFDFWSKGRNWLKEITGSSRTQAPLQKKAVYLVRIPAWKRNHSRWGQHWPIGPREIWARNKRSPSNGPVAG